MDKFLTKTERKKCKNMLKIWLNRCHLIFEEHLQEKNICFNPDTLVTNRANILTL